MKRVLVLAAAAVMGLALVPACNFRQILRLGTAAPEPVSAQRPKLAPGELAVTWLGAAGALVRGRNTTVAFDPYVSRLNLVTTVMGNPRPDTDAVDKYIPKVDVVLIGHAHEDHILDAPYIVQRDKADMVGSLTAVNVARAYGAPTAALHAMGGGDALEVRGVRIHATRMSHISMPVIKRPFPGVMHQVRGGPLRGSEFRDGGALLWRVVVDGIRVGHLSSPKLPAHLPDNLDVDVLFLSLAAGDREAVTTAMLTRTHPRFLVPIHHDIFFLGLESDPRPAPGFNYDDLVLTASTASPDTRVIGMMPMREHIVNVKTGRWRR